MNANMSTLWVLALTMSACATVQLGAPSVVSRDVLRSSTKQVELPEQRVIAEIDGADVLITAQKMCGTQRLDVVRTTERKEFENASAGWDWTFGVSGAAALGVGAGLVVDSVNVYDTDPTSKNYNSAGPGMAATAGYATLGAGAVLLGVAIVDGVRSLGHEDATRTEQTEEGTPIHVEPCGAVANVAVTVVEPSKFPLGTTDASGALRVSALPLYLALRDAHQLQGVQELEVTVPSGAAAALPMMALTQAADDQLWSAANTAACATPTSSSACRGLETYMDVFRGGKNGLKASMLYIRVKPRLELLRDWEAMTAAGNLRACEQKQTPHACARLQAFVSKYAIGAEASQARAILATAGPGLAALQAKLDRQRRFVEVSNFRASPFHDRSLSVEFDATKHRDPGAGRVFRLEGHCAVDGRNYADDTTQWISGAVDNMSLGETRQQSGLLFWPRGLPGEPTRCDVTVKLGPSRSGSILGEYCIGACE